MNLRKYHGLGNDFLIAFDEPVDAELARAVCDRHRGVGADGLIGATREPRMVLYNADGSRAETSGNGLRCLARALVDVAWQRGPEFAIATDAGSRRVAIATDGSVSVDMGPANIDGEHVDLGNPHRVVFVESLDGLAGPERPEENVEFVVTGPGDGELSMRVWERGVGETQACGSGASAAAAVAHAKGLVAERVTVHQPGGDVVVDLSGDTVVLTGPAEFVCEVVWPWR
jgi:diaminopimelate epimerase